MIKKVVSTPSLVIQNPAAGVYQWRVRATSFESSVVPSNWVTGQFVLLHQPSEENGDDEEEEEQQPVLSEQIFLPIVVR